MSHIIPFLQGHPYSALFGLIFIEEVGVWLPVPGDVILIFYGAWSHDGYIYFPFIFIAVLIATLIGATVLYFISRWLGSYLLNRFEKQLSHIHITQHNIATAEHWMTRHGWITLIVLRLIPGIRIVGSVAAGVLHVPYYKFIIATLASTVLWILFYYYLGVFLGWRFAYQIDRLLSHPMFGLSVLVLAVVGWSFFVRYALPFIRKRWFQSKNA